ncbi:MAG: phytoene desaturase family protein [Gemmatimonadota bacterium]
MTLDAVVVGAGPNGLAAGIALARAGLSVLVVEGAEEVGGGARTAELTRPGFRHDVCSAVYPLAAASPFLARLPLGEHGLQWIHPPTPMAHPLRGNRVGRLERSLPQTSASLGPDARAYERLVGPLAERWGPLFRQLLGPVRLPEDPFLLLRFGCRALPSARRVGRLLFRGETARALYAGLAGHAVVPLDRAPSSAVALVLAIAAHAVGWPVPRGGAGAVAAALASYLRSLGGEIRTGERIGSVGELPPARATLLSVTPRQLLRLAGDRLPAGYRRRLERFRYGPGVFKVDWALSEPIPWQAAGCARAGTVHVGGTAAEIEAAEAAVWRGEHPARPFVLLAQPSLFDRERAPPGRHTAWAYCHVPNGSPVQMTERIEAQVERFAPGFRDCILARHTFSPAELERYEPNCVGGDIGGGSNELGQLLWRPVLRRVPYSTPVPGLYLCSASTPPGGGVHGMCGYHAARVVLRESFGVRRTQRGRPRNGGRPTETPP